MTVSPDPFQVLAFDPGGATGWALFSYSGLGQMKLESDTLWHPEHHVDIRYLISSNYLRWPLTVVTESFEFRQSPDSAKSRRGLELVSREYIGVMKLVCADLNVPLVQQKAGHAIGFMTDEKLEKLGVLEKPLHENRHRNDALRHLYFYLVSKKNMDEIKGRLKK